MHDETMQLREPLDKLSRMAILEWENSHSQAAGNTLAVQLDVMCKLAYRVAGHVRVLEDQFENLLQDLLERSETLRQQASAHDRVSENLGDGHAEAARSRVCQADGVNDAISIVIVHKADADEAMLHLDQGSMG